MYYEIVVMISLFWIGLLDLVIQYIVIIQYTWQLNNTWILFHQGKTLIELLMVIFKRTYGFVLNINIPLLRINQMQRLGSFVCYKVNIKYCFYVNNTVK